MRRARPLTPAQAATLERMARDGRSAADVSAALGGALTERTAARRIHEIVGPQREVPPTRRPQREVALPESPDAIPAGTDLATIDLWLARADQAGCAAAAAGNLAGLGAMGRLTRALLDARRRALPPEQPDPGANPDMRELAVAAVRRLHELVALIADDSGG